MRLLVLFAVCDQGSFGNSGWGMGNGHNKQSGIRKYLYVDETVVHVLSEIMPEFVLLVRGLYPNPPNTPYL